MRIKHFNICIAILEDVRYNRIDIKETIRICRQRNVIPYLNMAEIIEVKIKLLYSIREILKWFSFLFICSARLPGINPQGMLTTLIGVYCIGNGKLK